MKVLYSKVVREAGDQQDNNLAGERILLSATDCDVLMRRLEYSNRYFPSSMASMQFREKMNLGVLYGDVI